MDPYAYDAFLHQISAAQAAKVLFGLLQELSQTARLHVQHRVQTDVMMQAAVDGDHAAITQEFKIEQEAHLLHQNNPRPAVGGATAPGHKPRPAVEVVDTKVKDRVWEILVAMDTNRDGSLSAVEVKKTLSDMLEVRPDEIPDDHDDVALFTSLTGLSKAEKINTVIERLDIGLIDQYYELCVLGAIHPEEGAAKEVQEPPPLIGIGESRRLCIEPSLQRLRHAPTEASVIGSSCKGMTKEHEDLVTLRASIRDAGRAATERRMMIPPMSIYGNNH